MFDIKLIGEETKLITIRPREIIGHDIDGLENCSFYTRVAADHIKFIKNRFHSQWFDVKTELLAGNFAMMSPDNQNMEINKKLVQLAFNPKLGNSISFRYEVSFCDDGKPLIVVRAINKHIDSMTEKWCRTNVPSVLVTEIEVKTLNMDPPIATLGFSLPFYPILFAPTPLKMADYEAYCLRVMPDILAMLVKHTNYSPEQMAELISANTPVRNEQR